MNNSYNVAFSQLKAAHQEIILKEMGLTISKKVGETGTQYAARCIKALAKKDVRDLERLIEEYKNG